MNIRVLATIFGLVLLVVGLGVAISSEKLLAMCHADCWLNGLLYAFLGEHHGKFILGALWYLGGVYFIYRGVFGRRGRQRKE